MIVYAYSFYIGSKCFKQIEKYLSLPLTREIIKLLKHDGWFEVACAGDHHQFKHPHKKGRTTVKHPDKDIPIKTLRRIEGESGLKFR